MNKASQIGLILSTSSLLFLTGCQHFSQPQVAKTPQVQAANQFNLQGKIGVRTPQQSGSAFFTWVQQQQDFDIELTGILGVGKTQIQGRSGVVTLNSAKTGKITASTPEELLERATGWQAPITHIVSWVQGKPATTSAKTTQDAQGRISTINEDGWNIQLSYEDNQNQPNRLVLTQLLENNKENRITMVIQSR